MKRITKISSVALILAVAVCIGLIPTGKVDAKSKNIYFAGEYRMKIKGDSYYVLSLSQFSSPEGKKVGSYEMMSCDLPSFTNVYICKNGELTRVGKNKYKSGKMKIRVYKKKIVISKGGDYNGTYKLKKRYVS